MSFESRPICAALLLLSMSCAGPAGEPGPGGEPGGGGDDCTVVTTREGEAAIRCADGSSTTLSASPCSVETEGDTHTILCPGTEPIVLRDGERVRSGAVRGEAIRFGLPPAAGIRVSLRGEGGRSAATDEDGNFRIAGLRPGLYRLEIAAEGYQAVEVPNLLVVGQEVDLGTFTLTQGRVLGTGPIEPILSPNEQRVALQRPLLFPSSSGPLEIEIHDLEDGSVHRLAETYTYFEFLDDRYAFLSRPYGLSSRSEGWIFDIELDMLHPLGTLDEFLPAADGLLYVSTDPSSYGLRFLSLPGGEDMEIDASSFTYRLVHHRFAQVERGGELFLFDSERPTKSLNDPLAEAQIAHDEVSGAIAAVFDVRGRIVIGILDPSSGSMAGLTNHTPGNELSWSQGGSLLATSNDREVTVIDVETKAEQTWAVSGSRGVRFSPSGDHLAATAADGSMAVGDWRQARGASFPETVEVGYSEDERWAAACTSAGLQLVDTADFSTEVFPLDCKGISFVGEHVLVRTPPAVYRFRMGSGEEERFDLELYEFHGAGSNILHQHRSGEEIFRLDLITGERSGTGKFSTLLGWSGADDLYAILEPDGSLLLIDASDGSVFPVGRYIEAKAFGEKGFVFTSGDPRMLTESELGELEILGKLETVWFPFPER